MKTSFTHRLIKRTGIAVFLFSSLLLPDRLSAQGMVEYLLLAVGANCEQSVIMLPDSLYRHIDSVKAEATAMLFDEQFNLQSANYDTVQLNDAGIFQYLGNVIFDETDTVASKRHGYRFLANQFSIPTGNIAVVSFNLKYRGNWVGAAMTFLRSCSRCSCPTRLKMFYLYSILPNLVFNNYEYPYSQYNTDYGSLDSYSKEVIATMLNWYINNDEPATEDYDEIFDMEQIGSSQTIAAFCSGGTIHACDGERELFQYLETIETRLLQLGSENADTASAINSELLVYSVTHCFASNNYYLTLYETNNPDGYELLAYPIHANHPTLNLKVVYDGSEYSAFGYSYNWENSEAGIVYDGGGEFSYTNGFAAATEAIIPNYSIEPPILMTVIRNV